MSWSSAPQYDLASYSQFAKYYDYLPDPVASFPVTALHPKTDIKTSKKLVCCIFSYYRIIGKKFIILQLNKFFIFSYFLPTDSDRGSEYCDYNDKMRCGESYHIPSPTRLPPHSVPPTSSLHHPPSSNIGDSITQDAMNQLQACARTHHFHTCVR